MEVQYAVLKEVYEYNPESKQFEPVSNSNPVVATVDTMEEAIDYIEANAKPARLVTLGIETTDEHEQFLGTMLEHKFNNEANSKAVHSSNRVVHWFIKPSVEDISELNEK